jgi:signal transduction histidine kinase
LTAIPRTYHPRFNLFTKISIGFGLIIFIIVLLSFTILWRLKPEDQIEYRILPAVLYLEKVFNAEIGATKNYFNTLTSLDNLDSHRVGSDSLNKIIKKAFNDSAKLEMNISEFRKTADSVFRIVTDSLVKNNLKDVMLFHERYLDNIKIELTNSGKKSKSDGEFISAHQEYLSDSIRIQIQKLKLSCLSPLDKALKKNAKPVYTITEISIFLGLIFTIMIVIAIRFAHILTKPIQALQAGTNKVGEGQYETVPITSTDEIADLTQAFNLMSEKLKQLDEMRMAMMSEISHEMRTPLQVIKAGCYSIIHAKDGPQLTQRQRDAVGMIHQASNRINHFVNSFLDIAKMEAGLMKFNFQLLDLVELVTPLIQEAQLIAQMRQIVLLSHADPILPMILDKERISQAVSNLLSNALKYTPDNGKITVNITKLSAGIAEGIKGSESVNIEVQDSGVGIPEADLDKLFNKFYQAKNVPLVNEKGSGLGLALVKLVAEAHGGKVGVKSQVSVGSTFSIILPIKT